MPAHDRCTICRRPCSWNWMLALSNRSWLLGIRGDCQSHSESHRSICLSPPSSIHSGAPGSLIGFGDRPLSHHQDLSPVGPFFDVSMGLPSTTWSARRFLDEGSPDSAHKTSATLCPDHPSILYCVGTYRYGKCQTKFAQDIREWHRAVHLLVLVVFVILAVLVVQKVQVTLIDLVVLVVLVGVSSRCY